MAHVYDYLYDGIGVYWLPYCIPGRDADRLLVMDIQLIIALAVGLCACLYMLRTVTANFKKSDVDTKCGDCGAKKDSLKTDR